MSDGFWLVPILAVLFAPVLSLHPRLWKFWQEADPDTRRRWFWRLLLATLAFALLQVGIEQVCGGVRNTAAPTGIVSLQLARDPVAAAIILQSWGRSCRLAAAAAVGIDFLFILAYAPLLHFLCAWAASKLARFSQTAALLGAGLALDQLLAGVCDAGENVGLLVMLARGPAGPLSPWAESTAVLATAKFMLIACGLIYGLVGARFLEETRDFLPVAHTVRFSLSLALLAPLVLLSLDQSLDLLRVLAENLTDRPWLVIWFFIAALLFAAAAWYWARVLIYLLEPDALQSAHRGRRLAALILPRACWAIPLLLGALALWKASRPLSSPTDPTNTEKIGLAIPPLYTQCRLIGMALLMLVLTGIGLYLLRKRRDWLEERRRRQPNPRPLPSPDDGFSQALLQLDPGTRWVMVLTALPGLLLWLIVGFAEPGGMLAARGFGPAAVLLLGLGLLLPVGNFLVYAHGKTHVPFLTILLAAAAAFAAFDLGDNHALRTLKPPQEKPGLSRPDLTGTFAQWLRAREDRHQYGSYPVLFVAAEGGGIRAAYQAAVTLAHLQDTLQQPPVPVHFAQHTFLISSVSGGSLGAAVFACLADRYTAADGQAVRPPPRQSGTAPSWEQAADAVLKRDLLSPPLAGMLSPDLIQRSLPIAFHHRDGTPYFDRALGLEYALEQAWEEGIEETERASSNSAYPPTASGTPNPMQQSLSAPAPLLARRSVPALCLNATRAEAGERLVMSSLRLRSPEAATGKDGQTRLVPPTDLTDLWPPVDLRLSTAACLSARFPLITSSGYLPVARLLPARKPGEPPVRALIKQRYVDGGYFENSGLSTLADVLTLLRDARITDQHGSVIPWHPVVITLGFHGKRLAPETAFAPDPSLEAGPGQIAGPYDGPFPKRPRPGSGFDDVLTPVSTYIQTAFGHSTAAERRFNYLIGQPWPGGKAAQPQRISFAFYEYNQPLPLGWMLSLAARRELRRQIAVSNGNRGAAVKAALAPIQPS